MIDRIVWIVLAGVLLGFGAYHWTVTSALKSKVEDQDKQITQLTKDKVVLEGQKVALQTTNEEFKNTVLQMSKELENLRWAMDQNARDAEKRLKQARADAKKWQAKYDDILNAPVAEAPHQCESLALRLDRYIAVRQAELGR